MISEITSQQISIVLQGPYITHHQTLGFTSLDVIRKWRELLPDAEIIVSAWAEAETHIPEVDVWVSNINPGPTFRNRPSVSHSRVNNIGRQILSSKNGLKRATRPYAIKCRTDIMPIHTGFIDLFINQRPRCNDYSVFQSPMVTCRFCTLDPRLTETHLHICDIFHFGHLEDVLKLWDIELPEATEQYDVDIIGLDPFGRCIMMRDKYPRPEQYLALKCFQKKIPNLELNYRIDNNPLLYKLGERLIFNNFTIREHEDVGILLPERMLVGVEKILYSITDIHHHEKIIRRRSLGSQTVLGRSN